MTRERRCSTFAVTLLRNVMSTPTRGEKFSLTLMVETSNMDEGMGAPVSTSSTNPKSPSLAWKAVKVL